MRTECPTPEELRALLKALPSPAPARAQVAQVRARVLAQAAVAKRRDRMRSGLLVTLALAAGAVLAIGLRGPSGHGLQARYHGTITAPASARFTRVSPAPDELVVLESGTLHVEVSRLGQGERFRVRAGDGEVEVRGTAFDVTADGGRLSHVEVEHGRVEVRSPGAARAVLDAGQGWAPSEHAAARAQPEASSNEPATDAPPSTAVVAPHPVSKHVAPSVATSAAPSDQPKPEPDVAARAVVPAPSPSVAPPARRAPAPALTGSAGPGDATEAPASSDRARDDDRRERRDERRERHDQRRIR